MARFVARHAQAGSAQGLRVSRPPAEHDELLTEDDEVPLWPLPEAFRLSQRKEDGVPGHADGRGPGPRQTDAEVLSLPPGQAPALPKHGRHQHRLPRSQAPLGQHAGLLEEAPGELSPRRLLPRDGLACQGNVPLSNALCSLSEARQCASIRDKSGAQQRQQSQQQHQQLYQQQQYPHQQPLLLGWRREEAWTRGPEVCREGEWIGARRAQGQPSARDSCAPSASAARAGRGDLRLGQGPDQGWLGAGPGCSRSSSRATSSAGLDRGQSGAGPREAAGSGPGSPWVEGYIFGCTKRTRGECFSRGLFGVPKGHRAEVERICVGTPLFLFNFDSRTLEGVFQASSRGGWELQADAWADAGTFPAQVGLLRCSPLLHLQPKAWALGCQQKDAHPLPSVGPHTESR